MDNEQIYQKLGSHPNAYEKMQADLTALEITLDPPVADLAKADAKDLGRALNALRRRAMRLQNNQKPASKRKGDDLMEWLSIAEDALLKDEQKRADYDKWLTQQAQTSSSSEPETSEPKEITLEELLLLGKHFLEYDQPEKAFNVSEMALERSPRNPDVWFLRGRALIALEKYPPAIKVFERLVDMQPTEALYHYILGALYDDAQAWNDALKQYREAEKIAPSARYRALIGDLLFRQFKRYDEAVALLQSCVKEDPENEGYQKLLALAVLSASKEHWTLIEQFGMRTRLVTERRQAVQTLASLKQVVGLPALEKEIKEEIILRIAEAEKALHRSWPEHWWAVGGWVVALAGLLGIVQYFFLRSIGNGLYFLLGAGLYAVAGRTPQYILNRQPPADPLKPKSETNGCLGFFIVVGALLFLPVAIAWNFLRNYIAAPLPQKQGRLVTTLVTAAFALVVLVGGGFLVNIGALSITPAISSAAGKYVSVDLKVSSPGSSLAGYVDGQGVEHVNYISSDGHVHQLSLNSAGWADSDLTANGPAALSGSPLDSYTHGNTVHVNYLGSNHHVYELYFDGSRWSIHDLTSKAGGANAASSSSLTGYMGTAGSEHVNYISSDHHVHELFFDGSRWTDNDLISLSHGQNAAADSGLVGYLGSDSSIHVNYVGSNRQVYELYFSGSWSDNDLTSLSGGQKAASGSLTGYWDHANSVHVFMVGADNHIHELFFDSHSGHWSDNDLTKAGNSSAQADAHSTVTAAFTSSDDEYVDYLGSDQHVHQFSYSSSGWNDSDLTAQVKATAPVAGSALTIYLTDGDKVRIDYINTSNHLSEILVQ